MSQPITMPALSDTMSNGRLVKWIKKPGDAIKKGDVIAEVETDKAVMDVEAFQDGYLSGPLAEEGAEAPVGQVIGYIADDPKETRDVVPSATVVPRPGADNGRTTDLPTMQAPVSAILAASSGSTRPAPVRRIHSQPSTSRTEQPQPVVQSNPETLAASASSFRVTATTHQSQPVLTREATASLNFPARRSELQKLMAQLGRELPAPMAAFANLHAAACASGALNTKTKELVALAIAVATHCDSCIAYHVRDALTAGATRNELLETLGVAVMMGGGPAAMYACDALTALEQFEGRRT